MKISIEFLKEKNACQAGIDWFMNQNETELIPVLRALGKDNHEQWANWLIVRCMTRQQYLAYAIYAAEQVIGIYEKKYPWNTDPRTAIDAAKKVLESDTEENRQIAAKAAKAAYAAYVYAIADAYAVYAAAYAVYAAAYAAAYAVEAVEAVTAAYASFKRDKVSKKNMYAKILNYGIELIHEW